MLAVALATLPLKKLVTFYMYLVSSVILFGAYYLSSVFVNAEKLSSHDRDTLPAILEDRDLMKRVILQLVAQCFIAAIVGYLLNLTDWTKYLLLVFALPVIARLAGLPCRDLPAVHNFSTIFTTLMASFTLFNHLGLVLDLGKDGVNRVNVAVHELGWIPVIIQFWHTIMLPAQLVMFWLFLYCTQLYIYVYTENHPVLQEGWIVVVLASIGECCATPVSLFALCVTISYISYYILTLTKLYLQGLDGLAHDNDNMRGWAEGFTMLLIAVQTGLLELKPLQRAFLMSILLFIVASSLIQSMYELTDPVLLSLSAAHNKSVLKHLRAVLLCTILWMLPLYMTYSICQYFDLDFWLMIIVSSCLLTSVQVIGSLVVYLFFMYDTIRNEPWEALDDIVYYTRSTVRVLEFLVAVFVVCYGLKESFSGEWSWVNSSILIVHCYFNVWQRLQSGWKIFLLRCEAVKKIESLPMASEEQLSELNDVCAICFNEMNQAKITNCGHFYHASCLRKWLYVKDTCPMCHQKIHVNDSASPGDSEGTSTTNDNSSHSSDADDSDSDLYLDFNSDTESESESEDEM